MQALAWMRLQTDSFIFFSELPNVKTVDLLLELRPLGAALPNKDLAAAAAAAPKDASSEARTSSLLTLFESTNFSKRVE